MYKIIQFFSLASQKIAIISLVLWFMSLWSVVLVSYKGDTIVGFPIVMLGFLGGNFAWFVNPLLLFLFYKLINKSKSKYTLLIISLIILLALNTIFLDTFQPVSAGVRPSALYGFGWGFVFWTTSIITSLIAVGYQYRDIDNAKTISKTIKYLGLIFLTTFIFSLIFLNYSDKTYANGEEKVRLSKVVVKKGSVCTSIEKINNTTPLIGALEVIYPLSKEFKEPLDILNMFYSPVTLLSWGIPLVHMKGMDYSLLQKSNETLLIAKSSDNKPQFRLTVSSDSINNIRINLKKMQDTEHVLFDEIWENTYKKSYQEQIFCPDLKAFPTSNQNPRKIILDALQIYNNPIEKKRLTTQYSEANTFNKISIKLEENKITEKYLSANAFYNNCPNSIYVPTFGEEPFLQKDGFSRAVKINEIYYFTDIKDFKSRGFRGYSCDKDHLYLYLYSDAHFGPNGDNSFILQKRSINDFTLISYAKIHYIEGKNLTGNTKILSVYERGDTIFIDLYNEKEKLLTTIFTSL